jgi:hypothetical protein
MNELPVFDTMTAQEARDTVAALRNEALALAQFNQDLPKQLRLDAHADRLERNLFASRPIVYRAARAEVIVESAGVRRVVESYQNGEDRPAGAA